MLLVRAFSSPHLLLVNLRHFVIVIGQVVRIPRGLLPVFMCLLGTPSSPGNLKSSLLYHDLLQKPNTELWLLLVMSLHGFGLFLLISTLVIHNLLFFTVVARQLFTLQQTPCSMKEPSTLSWTVSLFVIKFSKGFFIQYMSILNLT
jgi:hypothetical protein